jgi:hypothetical protein
MRSALPLIAMRSFMKIVMSIAFGLFCATASIAQNIPGGRLTLSSYNPIMPVDVVNAGTVYYAPYTGNQIPIYNGTSMTSSTFQQLTLTLSSSQTAGGIYDIFAFLHSGAVTIGVGPAWPSGGRGSTSCIGIFGVDTAVYVSCNAMTLTNGSTTYTGVAAQQATYLGSLYTTADGETSMQTKPAATPGGAANVLGLYNAYNRVRVIASNNDSTSPAWTSSTASWKPLNVNSVTGTSNNYISFLDGLGQSYVDAMAQINIYTSSNSVYGFISVEENSFTGTPTGTEGTNSGASGIYGQCVVAIDHFMPQQGFNYIAAVQYSTGATATFFNGSGGTEELKIELEM